MFLYYLEKFLKSSFKTYRIYCEESINLSVSYPVELCRALHDGHFEQFL